MPLSMRPRMCSKHLRQPLLARCVVLLLGEPQRADDVADDVVVDGGDEIHLALWVKAGVGHGGQRLLDVVQRVGSRDRRRPWAHRVAQPRVALEVAPCRLGDRGEAGAPALLQLGVVDELAAHDLVAHEVEELVLAVDVVVEAHRPEPELGGDAPHRHGVEALGVGDGDGGLGDVVARARRAAPGRLGAHPDRLLRPRRAGVPRPRCCSRGSLALDISYSVLLPYAVRTTVHRTNEELHVISPRRRHLRRRARPALRRSLGAARRRPRRAAGLGARSARPQRRRQDHRRAHPDHAAAADRGPRRASPATTSSRTRRSSAPSSASPASRPPSTGCSPRARTSRWSAASITCRERRFAPRAEELLERLSLADAADRLVQDVLRRHAPPARPRRQPRRHAARPLPRRADHRPRPAQPHRAVGPARESSCATARRCC